MTVKFTHEKVNNANEKRGSWGSTTKRKLETIHADTRYQCHANYVYLILGYVLTFHARGGTSEARSPQVFAEAPVTPHTLI